MKEWQCRCGKSRAVVYESAVPPACEACPSCGTALAKSPDLLGPAKPHEWETKEVETEEGLKTVTSCRMCGKPQEE